MKTMRMTLAALVLASVALWEARIERLVAGEAPERIGRIPLEVIDQMREQPCGGERPSPEF
jgi:hypothetical protein